jgi:23S rRNA (uracil747-C5)-methyltransferase
MDCDHFDAGRCRSCTWLPRPYDEQLAAKQELVAGLLAAERQLTWLPPVASTESGFRNKAKMVVTGTVTEPALGILGEGAAGVDLRDCGLHAEPIRDALPVLAEFITRAALTPYELASRRGELKFVLVTANPAGELMVRFVSRSQEPVTRIRKHLPWLSERLTLAVASVNVQPEHKAVVEGELEIVLTERQTLTVRVNEHELLLRPQSFFQTNTAIAAALYREARDWTGDLDPGTIWDLYCGVGGFARHLAGPGRSVVGVESSAEAVAAAQQGAPEVRFVAGDAAGWATGQDEVADLVVVNPPRRGIGIELAGWLETSGVPHLLYSSCNPLTLARDLAAMPSLRPRRGRLFDMFPQTAHAEVLLWCERA